MKQLLLRILGHAASTEATPSRRQPETKTHSAEELQEQARTLLKSVGCQGLAASLVVRWNPRMRSTAGTANHARGVITLNPKIQEFGGAEIELTLRHELAHLVAQARAGSRRIRPHGPEWRQACRDLGIPQETRCHQLPLPRRRVVRKHLYRCGHCRSEFPRVRPFRRRVACLSCCRRYSRGRYDERFRLVKVRE